jgi:alpha-amylase/alpha-mannosidase (GH57 family)
MYDINGVKIVFRLRELSDAIGFKYQKMEGLEGANHLIYSLYNYYKNLQDGTYLIVLILDGENAWEWFKNDGKEFFDAFYSQLENAEWIKTITISEYIDKGIYRNLDYLWPGSWINADFNIWIGESQENTAWEYLKRVRMDFEKMKEGKDNKKVENAYENLLKAEGSDWFWWYGDDQNSMMDEMFDRTFRDYLKNVYIEIGEKIPEFLNYEIK